MKLALDIVTHIYLFNKLKMNAMCKAVTNVENKYVYQ